MMADDREAGMVNAKVLHEGYRDTLLRRGGGEEL